MKKNRRGLCALVAFLFFPVFFFSSCSHAGLGEEVDLEAPVLTVSSMKCEETVVENFNGGVICHGKVSFYGTATDNNRVERVYAQVKWSKGDDYVTRAQATLSGDSWSLDIDFSEDDDDAYFVNIIAEDPVKNISPRSTESITLFIDSHAPVANAWYVDRKVKGMQYNLQSKETLEKLDLDLPENKDAAQNVAFDICANVTDAFGVSEVTLQIRDSSDAVVAEIENSAVLDSSSSESAEKNNYAPRFAVTHDILAKGNSSENLGGDGEPHYLQVWYTAKDTTQYPGANESGDTEVELGWFIWWPESDEPRITNSDIVATAVDGSSEPKLELAVKINSSINLSVFDDDALDTAYFALLTATEAELFGNSPIGWDSIATSESDAESFKDRIKAVLGGDSEKRVAEFKETKEERETSISLTAASTPQIMRLIAFAWDKTDAKKFVHKDITVQVTDESTPILLITTPKNNTIPAMSANGDVTIEGQTLDTAGCSYLEFVWVPNAVAEKRAQAQNWLDGIVSAESHDTLAKATNRITEKDGMKLWSVPLVSADPSNGFQKSTFSFTVNLFNDFNGTAEQALDKYFLVKLTRKDLKYVYQEYKLSADNLPPTIVGVTPSADMQIVSNEKALTLKFYGKKDSGLPMDTKKYRIERVDKTKDDKPILVTNGYYDNDDKERYTNVGYNESSGYYEATLSQEAITKMNESGMKPKYRFYATDIFGNEGFDQYTLDISDLPTLKSISSTAAAKCKLGDKIDIIATFSKTVGISESSVGKPPQLKLKGIKNAKKNISATDAVYADYTSGNGTTAIHFTYTVQDGDQGMLALYTDSSSGSSDEFPPPPLFDNDSGSFTKEKVIINSIGTGDDEAKNYFDARNIEVDGNAPAVTGCTITPTGGQTVSEINYMKEGTSLSVTLALNKSVTVGDPSPAITFSAGDGSDNVVTLPFANISGTGSSTTLTFSTTIASDTKNGALSYRESSYITNASSITDTFGNPLAFSTDTSLKNPKIVVDTSAPKTPVCPQVTNGTFADGKKYKDSVTFTLEKAEADNTIRYLQYSVDGGSKWTDVNEKTETKLTASASFTYRAVDYAGNVSNIREPIYLDIESSFPAYTVECTASDGYYKAGTNLTLRVLFERPVNVAANAGAYISVTGKTGESFGKGANGGKAELLNNTAKTAVSYIDFTYIIQDPDEFTFNVAKDAVVLAGVTDQYGIAQGSKTLAEAYVRENVHCDGVAPKVVSMVPGTKSGGGYTGANKIVLTFSEPVTKAGGNITLRRVANWAIPPVLSAEDFNKIVNALPSTSSTEIGGKTLDKSGMKNVLALQNSNGSDMEDSEYLYGSDTDHAGSSNRYYHGTGQFVGPYKRSTQGINEDGSPDVTTKYVLAFDMGIWETTEEHFFGQTFTTTGNSASATRQTFANNVYAYQTTGESATPKTLNASNSTLITVGDIRAVLEEAGYHKRTLDVNSTSVDVNDRTVTITFPAGLCDSADLPSGIEWELVIDKKAFMDKTGNYFGANSVGDIKNSDAWQVPGSGTQTEVTEIAQPWGRARASSSSPVVLIQPAQGAYSFFSYGVAEPVVRVDRYSYGLGIYQSDSNGNKSSRIDSDAVKPTGYARVRIDCQTRDAGMRYTIVRNTSNPRTETNSSNRINPYITKGNGTEWTISYYTNTSNATKSSLAGQTGLQSYTKDTVFAAGNGNYKQSCKHYIVAEASKTNLGSSRGYEGVFQTVARLYRPYSNIGNNNLYYSAAQLEGRTEFSIRGTTGWAGEPYISPFPLRDAQFGAPYMRRCFRENTVSNNTNNSDYYDYYWVSYEILVGSSFSGCNWGRIGNYNNYTGQYYYVAGWGWLEPGEFTICHNLRNWE